MAEWPTPCAGEQAVWRRLGFPRKSFSLRPRALFQHFVEVIGSSPQFLTHNALSVSSIAPRHDLFTKKSRHIFSEVLVVQVQFAYIYSEGSSLHTFIAVCELDPSRRVQFAYILSVYANCTLQMYANFGVCKKKFPVGIEPSSQKNARPEYVCHDHWAMRATKISIPGRGKFPRDWKSCLQLDSNPRPTLLQSSALPLDHDGT